MRGEAIGVITMTLVQKHCSHRGGPWPQRHRTL